MVVGRMAVGLLTLLACLSVAASTGRSVAAVRQKIDLQNPNPGMPSKMSVIIINTAADDLNLITSTVGAGAWLYQPPATVARYGAPGTFNYGYTQLAPLGGGPINSTVTYRAPTSGDAADEPAFADLFLFSILGEFGLSVESSERAATVTVNGGLVGNDKVTEAIYVVNIAPPPNATRPL